MFIEFNHRLINADSINFIHTMAEYRRDINNKLEKNELGKYEIEFWLVQVFMEGLPEKWKENGFLCVEEFFDTKEEAEARYEQLKNELKG